MNKKLNNRIHQMDKNLDEIVKNPYETKKTKLPFWSKILIPVGAFATAAIALAIIIPLTINAGIGTSSLNRLTRPKLEKITEDTEYHMSELAYNSYTSFAKKFTSFVMETNNTEEEKSLGVSIPDAYLCLAITGLISEEAAMNDILSYYELNSVDELRTSVKEVLSTLCTLTKNGEGKLIGGFNLNSIWFNPKKVELIKEKDEELYKNLEEVFDASLYLEALTTDKANKYIKENSLKGMPVPTVELNDEDPSALNVMSTYTCLDYFDQVTRDYYRNQYDSGSHKMNYTVDNSVKSVDYIEAFQKDKAVYEGENFVGSSLNINMINMEFYLPNDVSALPSSIMDDVLNENYQLKEITFVNFYDEEVTTSTFDVNFSAPYFSLDNSIDLKRNDLEKLFPHITKKGAGARIAYPLDLGNMFLDYVKQFSVMKFNYDGFYSSSVTISGIGTESAPAPNPIFDLVLDHPYVFKASRSLYINDKIRSIPMVIGEIVDPAYSE